MVSKTFCPLPWTHTAIRNNGDLRVCCQANTAKDRGILRDANGRPFNARTHDLEEARNAPLLKDVRRAMLLGRYHSVCLRCQTEDESGIRSRRAYENENWKHKIDFARLIQHTTVDGTIDTTKIPATYYDIRFGNRCNLRCRMCGPTDSDSWYKDQVRVWGTRFRDTHGDVHLTQPEKGSPRPIRDDYSWVDDENFWVQLNSNISNIQHIYAVGGEPLLIDKHYDLLQNCVDHDVAKNIVLEYNSNISTIPDKAITLWEKFKEVRVGASIDGFGAVDEYIRYPSKWSKIEANLRLLNKAPSNILPWIAVTVQAYNILHLPDMIAWKLDSGLDRINYQKRAPVLTTHPLHSPDFLHVQLLPPKYKALVSHTFSKFLASIEGRTFDRGKVSSDQIKANIKRILNGYEHLMMAHDRSEMIPKFWFYTKRLDQIRNQSAEAVFPELCTEVEEWMLEKKLNPHHDISNLPTLVDLDMQSISMA